MPTFPAYKLTFNNHMIDILLYCLNSSKLSWWTAKKISQRFSKSSFLALIVYCLVITSKENADLFENFFSANSMLNPPAGLFSYLLIPFHMFKVIFNMKHVLKMLHIKKASGLNEIPAIVLKIQQLFSIVTCLFHIFHNDGRLTNSPNTTYSK